MIYYIKKFDEEMAEATSKHDIEFYELKTFIHFIFTTGKSNQANGGTR